MGCAGSKQQQPKSEKKKSSNNVVTDARAASSVVITKETKITHQVYSTRESTSSSRTSHTIAASSSTTASAPTRSYTPVYQRPALTKAVDASRPFSYLEPLENSNNRAISPAFKTTNSIQPPSSSSGTYDLSKKAYVLVFHHERFKHSEHNRKGSARDLEKLKQVLRQYRCDEPDVRENLTKAQVESKMDQISKKDFSQYSCLIVFIMSHGNANDTIMAHDGKLYSFQGDVVENCTKNRTLNDKPKLFVLQACRGDAQIVADATPSMSHKVDLVIFQSSYQGAVSYRDQQKGSFFMQAFLRLLHEHNSESIVKINTLLNDEFTRNGILQTPTLMTTLRKELIFRHLLRRR